MTARASSTTHPEAETRLLEPLRDVSHAVAQHLAQHVVAEGLGPGTFWPLHHLDRGPEVHPGRLARRLGVTPATCTASVDQLVELGYVVRRPSPSDRRQIVLVVTPKGHRTLETVWRSFDTSLRAALVGIPPEDIATTARTLRTIASLLPGEAPASEEGPA